MPPSPLGRGGASGRPVSGTILVVENAFVGGFLQTALAQQGYEVICLERVGALTLLRDVPEAVDLLITNIPAAFAEFSGLPVLYLAAAPDLKAIEGIRRCLCLRK